MFDFGNSLLTMNPDEQKKMLANRTPGQRKSALEMGIGFKNQNQRQQQHQQEWDAYHGLDRLNTIIEKENEAHDFFGKGLADWKKNVTGKQSARDATNLRKQFDDYESSILSTVPKGGKRHTALTDSLPKIKSGFLKESHQFALDKLNQHTRTVLDKGLQRIAKGALGSRTREDIKAHDDAAFDLINKYVLSEAKFDAKDADAMYGEYLGYAGVEKPKPAEGEAREHGDRQEAIASKAKADATPPEEFAKSSAQHAREMEKTVETRNNYPEPKDNYPFTEKTYEFLGKNKDAINSAAAKFDVSPEAVAGAMGDEFNRSNITDPLQDKAVATFGSLDEVENEIKEGVPKGFGGKRKWAGQDIGPGNMRVETLHQMFVERVENGDDNDKLKKALDGVIDPDASRDDQWKQYVEYATTPEGTATLASAHMDDAASKLAPHMEGLSQEEKDAVLVTYYKQGPDYLKKYQNKVGQYTDKKAGADSKNYRPIKPGEGAGFLHQINKIRSAIGR